MTLRPAVVTLATLGKLNLLELELGIPAFFSQASCDSSTAEYFFSEEPSAVRQAKSICESCPIADLCLDWAMQHEEYGVFGGATPEERELARKGQPVINLDDVRKMQGEREFILSARLQEVADTFQVDARTAVRWRKTLVNATEKAS